MDKKIEEWTATANENEDVNYLGRLFWFTIGETTAPVEELDNMFSEEKLDSALLPEKPKPKNAWRRAMKDMEHREEKELSNGQKMITELMVRKLDKDTYHLVREVRRTDKGRLEYKELMKWTYDNNSDAVYFHKLTGDDDIDNIHYQMRNAYLTYKRCYTEYEIRRSVNESIDNANKISLKSSGGVYFIPEDKFYILQDIKKLLDGINKWGKSHFQSELWEVPVISDGERKDMIESGIREETVAFTARKMEIIKELLDNKTEITQKRYNTLIAELKEIEERKQMYADLIGRNLEVCDEQLEIMKAQLRKLMDNVKE